MSCHLRNLPALLNSHERSEVSAGICNTECMVCDLSNSGFQIPS